MRKYDHKLVGLLFGLLMPILGILLFWGGAYGLTGLRDMGILVKELQKLSAVISIGLLANLPVFFLFYWKKKDESARGVIMATFIYGLVIVLIKFAL